MDKIDVFLSFLKSQDKKRKVTCYSHNKEIKIWAGESEGSGIIAYISYTDRNIYEDDIDKLEPLVNLKLKKTYKLYFWIFHRHINR
jgi:hypothetical protein